MEPDPTARQWVRSEGEAFELSPRIRVYFKEIGLTGDQIELLIRIAQRVAGAPADSDREHDGDGDR